MEEYNLSKNKRASKFKRINNREHQRLIKIYEDTMRVCHKLQLKPKNKSTLYDITCLEEPQLQLHHTHENIVEVIDIDTLDMTMMYCQRDKLNPLVINLASDYRPGGGVESGKTAQEECLFRRTNAFMTHPTEWYQLSKNNIIYSPCVRLIKDNKYNMLQDEDMISFSMITVAAIRKPKLNSRSSPRSFFFSSI